MAKLPPSQRPERQQPSEILMVGKPYHAARRQWPQGADYNFRAGGHELRIFLPNASKTEVKAAEKGKIEFGLLIDPPEIYIISRFLAPDGRPVFGFDCSYSWHMVSPDERGQPPAWEEVNPKLRALVTVIFVEGTTGIIFALRAVTYSPEFTRAFHRAIAEQIALPFDRAEHKRRTDAKVRQYDTAALWDLCQVHCTGGD
jgi:hypothetical protein